MTFRHPSICIYTRTSARTRYKVSAHLRLYYISALSTFSACKRDILPSECIVFYPIIFFIPFSRTIVWFSLVHLTYIVASRWCEDCCCSVIHYFYFWFHNAHSSLRIKTRSISCSLDNCSKSCLYCSWNVFFSSFFLSA